MLMDVDFDDTPNRCTTLVYYAWKIFTCLFLHVLLVTMVVLYCLLGAFTFQKLESEHELEVSFIDDVPAGQGRAPVVSSTAGHRRIYKYRSARAQLVS